MMSIICKKYSEIDFNLYEIVHGPFYECSFCCVGKEANNIFTDASAINDCGKTYYAPYNLLRTYSVDIPYNPYLYPNVMNYAPPSESGKICPYDSDYQPVNLSNRIKITIPNDPVFSGIYVFDRFYEDQWSLNNSESTANITDPYSIRFQEFPYGYMKYREYFYSDGSNLSSTYAFPAQFLMTLYLSPVNGGVVGTGHRAAVGFTLPIRYRKPYKDWVVVDQISHSVYGKNKNYGYINTAGNNVELIGDSVCSGISEFGFGYRVSALGLGWDGGSTRFLSPNVFIGYEADPTYPEAPFYEPKIPMLANVEFVYSCRPNNCSSYASIPTINFSSVPYLERQCGATVNNFIPCNGDISSATIYDNINIYAIFNPSISNQSCLFYGMIRTISPISEMSKILLTTINSSESTLNRVVNAVSSIIQTSFQYDINSTSSYIDIYLQVSGNNLDVYIYPSDSDKL